jgi:hypothetical protein
MCFPRFLSIQTLSFITASGKEPTTPNQWKETSRADSGAKPVLGNALLVSTFRVLRYGFGLASPASFLVSVSIDNVVPYTDNL